MESAEGNCTHHNLLTEEMQKGGNTVEKGRRKGYHGASRDIHTNGKSTHANRNGNKRDETYVRPESDDDDETTVTPTSEENSSREEECNTTEAGSEREKPDEKKMAEETKKIDPEKMPNPKEMGRNLGKK